MNCWMIGERCNSVKILSREHDVLRVKTRSLSAIPCENLCDRHFGLIMIWKIVLVCLIALQLPRMTSTAFTTGNELVIIAENIIII